MELTAGKVAVVTGAASGIGLALAERFADSGLHLVLADVDENGLEAAAEAVAARGVETLVVRTDVRDEKAVQSLAAKTLDRFGAAHVVCNNAGVTASADPWFGPVSSWEWVLGVNLWGVIHGVRAFLPHLLRQGDGHIVNTASIAGLLPGFGPSYDASKHAVVALSEDLFTMLAGLGRQVGVSVLCPGWVRTRILDASRSWPTDLGDMPGRPGWVDVIERHFRRAIDEGRTPAAVADLVADAVCSGSFWVFPHDDFVDLAVRRWDSIAARENPTMITMPGVPPPEQLAAEIAANRTSPTS